MNQLTTVALCTLPAHLYPGDFHFSRLDSFRSVFPQAEGLGISVSAPPEGLTDHWPVRNLTDLASSLIQSHASLFAEAVRQVQAVPSFSPEALQQIADALEFRLSRDAQTLQTMTSAADGPAHIFRLRQAMDQQALQEVQQARMQLLPGV